MLRTRRWLLAALLFVLPTVGVAARSVCVTHESGGCVQYRSCCFYNNQTGEPTGCWYVYYECQT